MCLTVFRSCMLWPQRRTLGLQLDHHLELPSNQLVQSAQEYEGTLSPMIW